MPNRYCNLNGNKKISEDFGNINIGFNKVQIDVDNLDSRVDNIVADAGSSNTEIVDARHDAVYSVTYPTLKDRLDSTSGRIRNMIFSVKDNGATGNGITDDTAAVMAAVDAAVAAGGGVVFFPPGIYKANIVLSSIYNITFQGVGKGSRLISLGSGYNILTLSLCNSIKVENLYFYSSGVDRGVVSEDNGIYATQTTNLQILNSTFENHGMAGICTYTSSNVLIDGNLLQAGFNTTSSSDSCDILISGSDHFGKIKITNNIMDSAGLKNGIYVNAQTSGKTYKDFVITNNTCNSHKENGIICYMSLADSLHPGIQDIKIIGNHCEENGVHGIYIQSCQNVMVQGNSTKANKNGRGGDGIEGGIGITASINVTVIGNTLDSEYGPAIKVNGHTLYSNRRMGVVVTGNVIKDCQTPAKPAIWIGQYMNECTISSNYIIRGASQAIYVQASGNGKDIILSNNNIDTVQSYGIFLDGGYVTVTGNSILKALYSGIVAGSCEYVNISNNSVVDCNTGNMSGGDGCGIAITGTSRFKVEGNRAYNRTAAGHQKYGFLVSGGNYGLLANNDFFGNETDEVNVVSEPTTFIRSRNSDGINSPL